MKKLLTFLVLSFLAVLVLPAPAAAHGGMEGLVLIPMAGVWLFFVILGIAGLLLTCFKVSSPITAWGIIAINLIFLGVSWYIYYINALSFTYAVRGGIHPSHLFVQDFMMFAGVTIGILAAIIIIAASFKLGQYKHFVWGGLVVGLVIAFIITMPRIKKEQEKTDLIENISKRPYLFGKALPEGEHDMSGLKDLEPELKTYSFYKAAEEGNVEVVKMLIGDRTEGEIQTAFSRAMNNPHYDACNTDANALEIMALLLDKGADVNIERPYSVFGEKYTSTPLTRAADCLEIDLVKFLLEHGADPNKTSMHGRDYNETALSNAYEHGGRKDKAIIELLLDSGADINIPGSFWGTILGYAVKYKDIDEVQWILDRKADVNVPNCEKRTPLHWAVREGKDDVAKLLIKYGANVNATDKFNDTPLFDAVEQNSTALAKILLERGADPNVVSNVYKATALDKAGTEEMKDLLRKYGAKTKEELEREEDLRQQFERYVQTVDIATVARTYDEEKTQNARVAVAENVPEKKPEEYDDIGLPVLFKAIIKKDSKKVADLIAKGVDVNQKNEYGYTPLMWAVIYPNNEIIKQLLNAKADANAVISFGKTEVSVLQLAIRNNHPEIAELLKQAGAEE